MTHTPPPTQDDLAAGYELDATLIAHASELVMRLWDSGRTSNEISHMTGLNYERQLILRKQKPWRPTRLSVLLMHRALARMR